MSFDADGVDLGPALRRLFGAQLGAATVHKLRGDASTRSYYRVTVEEGARGTGPASLIAMRLPADALRSDEVSDGGPPSELPFVAVQRLLAARGVPVPAIYVDDTPGRALLLEDLGDETFADRLDHTPRDRWQALYTDAVELLARMHAVCAVPDGSLPYQRRFDRTLLRWELDHFRQWGLEALHGPLASADRATLDAAFDTLTNALLALPVGFVHRDYQSRNLMWAGERGLVIIDFQDALLGPVAYDLVALLCDSYVALELPLQRAMIARYVAARGWPAAELPAFERAFWAVAVQRKLKDTGRFVFIDQVRGNPDFLRFYPQSARYVERALQQLGDDELLALLRRVLPGFAHALSAPAPATGRHATGA